MRRRILSVLLLLLAACTPPSPKQVVNSRTRIDTLPSGVIEVHNDSLPPLSDSTGLRLVETATINPPDSSAGMLNRPQSMTFDSKGNLYVMQRPPRVLVFDSTGNYLRTISREGDGPGEITFGMLGMRHDTLLVHQYGLRYAMFAPDGTPLKSTHVSAGGYWTDRPLITDTLGRTWLPGAGLVHDKRPYPESLAKLYNGVGRGPGWQRITADGTPIDSITMPYDTTIWPMKQWRATVGVNGEGASAGIRIPLQPEVRSSPRHDGLIVYGRNDQNHLIITRNVTDTIRIIHLPLPLVQMSDADRAAVMKQSVPDNSPFRGVAKAKDLPVNWPYFTSLTVDDQDRIWLTIPGSGAMANELLVLDRDGVVIGRMTSPHPRFAEAQWGPGRIAIPDEDSEGRPVVRTWRVRK